jgi:hypothetical protein
MFLLRHTIPSEKLEGEGCRVLSAPACLVGASASSDALA